MSLLSDNLRYLRGQKECSQKQIATDLIMERGRYAKYEDDKSEPPLEILKRISHYFKISIDMLVSMDVRNLTDEERYNAYSFSHNLQPKVDDISDI